MLRTGLLFACLGLCACATSPRTIEVEIDNQLGANSVTLWAFEIFNGFPLVSMWTTASWQAPPGPSVRRMEVCLPVHLAGVELTAGNADGEDSARTLRYRIELVPMPERGALRQAKQPGAPAISFFDGPASDQTLDRVASDVADFERAVAQAGSRAKLGCWGANIFAAMERAEAR